MTVLKSNRQRLPWYKVYLQKEVLYFEPEVRVWTYSAELGWDVFYIKWPLTPWWRYKNTLKMRTQRSHEGRATLPPEALANRLLMVQTLLSRINEISVKVSWLVSVEMSVLMCN